ncbi:glycoside hydrolase family 2 [Pedobacter sp. HMF7647]|uniref:Beta-galactosidase n=1 Tax=Hufsiella arboris TaxID=2695275 RepID=A0A7K1YDZ4_9SPHI|nr:glycoside hydrolase family 2 TIM barrel-domain containing protein [Hufsiella arboris]MXV52279.1 glycoside hydrolase family 2 [Hufsiella arboris]
MKFRFFSAIIILTGLFSDSVTAQTKLVQYLSGKDNDHTVAWDFFCSGGRKAGSWQKINVPGHWEQQGFGDYNYGRDYVTYGKNFRFADEKGFYKYNFSVPESWKGKEIKIVFEGSMTDTEVKINGKPAGKIHQGAFYRFKYDISDKLVYGKPNQLEVAVSKMSADQSVNNAERLADYWILGGIFRPVYLEAVPRHHIEWTSINAKADGNFAIAVHLENPVKGAVISAQIKDGEGRIVGNTQFTNSKADTSITLKTKVNNPDLWTAETPDLYEVTTTLSEGTQTVYKSTERFGFRTIEVRKGDGIYVNGTKIKMKGVNRHVWWPESGRCVNAGIDLNDVKLIKEMNMNAVRCSHYPPDASFLNYCDSLGLYVLDELAGWQKAYSTKAGEPLVKEMVTRDANHPSIIFWSNGNEGGHNFDLDDDYAKYDLSARTVIHAHHKPGNAINGIDCNHYEDYYSTQKILADSNIYMVTEFMHAQDDGAGGAGLSEMWNLHWNSKRGAGGFIWALLDEGLARTDHNGMIDVNGVNAPDGILGPHREKEGSFYAIREIFSPVKIDMKKLPDDFKGKISIENRYNFINIADCSFKWSTLKFRSPKDQFAGEEILNSGTARSPDIAPTQKGILALKLPADWKHADGLALSASDPAGKEIYRWVWKVKSNKQLLEDIVSDKGPDSVRVSENDSLLTVKGGEISVTFSKRTGMIASLANSTSMPLSFKDGPVLVSGNAVFDSLSYKLENNQATIEANYTGDMQKITWTMVPSGWLKMDYSYTLQGKYPFGGISFNYPENFVLGARWLGKGPYRVWKNRLEGVSCSTWENLKNNTQTGAAPWIYPEFKGYFADVSWIQMNTVEGKFLVGTPDDELYVRLFDFYGLTGLKPHPDLPKGDISFLDGIPAIGSKLGMRITPHPENYGPAGEMNEFSGEKRRTLYFYFGLQKGDNNSRQFVMPKENILTN